MDFAGVSTTSTLHKGTGKQKAFREFFFRAFWIEDLEKVGCTENINNECGQFNRPACIHHHSRRSAVCAKNKAHALAEWIKLHLA